MSWPLPSFTLILSGLFTAWILNSMWTIYGIFNPERCDGPTNCLHSSWTDKDRFQVFVCTSLSRNPLTGKLNVIWQDDAFLLIQDRKINAKVNLPAETIKNGSLYLHTVVTSIRGQRQPNYEMLINRHTVIASGLLTKYTPRQAEAFNLLNDGTKKSRAYTGRPVAHWKPTVVIDIARPRSLALKAIPGELSHLITLNPQQKYLPIVYQSDIRSRIKDLWPINSTHPTLPLEISFESSEIGKLRFMIIAETSLKTMAQLGFTEHDTDDVKGIFFDTGVYLLLLTIFVASFHMLFDFLAFKNDIQFWRSRNSMAGLSFSTLLWRCVSQFIITLYLFDQQTSLLVLVPSAIATVIEAWKIKKALRIKISGFKLTWSGRTKDELETDGHDAEFMKYLSRYVLYPLVVLGAIYSLVYTSHKSWYSWAIQSAANGVYAFGFLFMLPQLFINYKLKSVAHLPWKAFMYKAFNTFIDDVFAFILTSIPTSHRVAAFRDDIVFIIYLYQRWLYPVDKNRINEFGSTGNDDAQGSDETKKAR